MKGETIASVFLCTLFGALVYFDSRSVISTSVYGSICFFLFSRWSRHANKENLANSKYTKLMSISEAQMKKITEQKRSVELLRKEEEETQKELKNKSDEAEELKQQLTAAQKEGSKLKGSLEKKEQEANQLSQDLEAMKKEKGRLEQRQKNELEEHDKHTKELDEKATKAEAERDSLKKTVNVQKEEIEGLKKEVKILEQKERDLENEKEELTFKIQRYERTIHRADEMRQAIDQSFDHLVADDRDVGQAEAAEPSDKKEEDDSQS